MEKREERENHATVEGLWGNTLMELLAERYPQLYIRPAEGTEDAYKAAVTQGNAPGHDLSHFIGSDEDFLRIEQTPAGPVEVLFLKERGDFETFLRCIGYRSKPVAIPASVGAQTFFGLRNWKKIWDHKAAYRMAGGDDWLSELRRFDADKAKSRDTLILLSDGPYSALNWQKTPYSEEEWRRVSLNIRTFHECAHVVCRRTYPDQVLPLWDELTADLTGLRFATGSYDASLAAAFLGVTAEGYTAGGRLTHYLSAGEDPDKAARELWKIIGQLKNLSDQQPNDKTYDLLLSLASEPLLKR